MRVALYERRSTDEQLQPESHHIQDEQLRRYAVANHHDVVRVYPDSASGRNANRTGFKRLIRDITQGPDFDAVLVLDVTRWGRFANVDESAYWEFFCVVHGVRVCYVNEPFRDNDGPYDTLLKTLKRIQAAEFSRDKSRTVQYAKARVVQQGFHPGGVAPYGMTRLVVRIDGTVVQELQPGEHKAIGNYRIRLALGEPRAVAAVREIYRLFLAGMHRAAIARALDREKVPLPSKAKQWRSSEVTRILRNRAYAGCAAIRCKASANFPDGSTISTVGAWPAIIPLKEFDRVQERLEEQRWLHTPSGLAAQLRAAFERYGPLDSRRKAPDLAAWSTYLKHFRDGTQEALSSAYAGTIRKASRLIAHSLKQHFRVTREGDLLILNDLLVVKIVASFPRMLRRGVYWEYRFHDDDPQDVTIGIGFSPPPLVRQLQLFQFYNARFRPRTQRIHPNLDGHTRTNQFRRTIDEIVVSLQHNFYRDAHRARALLLATLAEYAIAGSGTVARRLGWPETTTYALYRSLQRAGHMLPPLKQKRKGLVTVTCSGCKHERRMGPWSALKLKTDYCGSCWQAAREASVHVTCPKCGAVRRYRKADLARLANGAKSPCASCMPGQWPRAYKLREANNALRRGAFFTIAEVLRDRLAQRYRDVRVCAKKHVLAPVISWRETGKSKRQFLRLRCSQAEALALAAYPPNVLRAGALELADRRRWHGTEDKRQDLWMVRVIPSRFT